MVHTTDIGEAAAEQLLNKNFTDRQVIYLGYERPYTLHVAAAILGRAIGKPDLAYVAFSFEGAKQAMVGIGLSESLADQYIEFSKASSEGKITEADDAGKFQKSPASLEDFSKIFADAYQA